MKRSSIAVLFLALGLSLSFTSCKKEPKDGDIQKVIMEKLANMPDMAGISASVKDGVATITGECANADVCTSVVAMVENTPGVKSVVKSCTVKPEEVKTPETPVVPKEMSALEQSVKDAIKDNPSVSAELVDGVIVLSGEIQKKDVPTLMRKLKSMEGIKSVDQSGLTIK
jgi:osmotically-inducible protein OsmY